MRTTHVLRGLILATAAGVMIRGDLLYGLFCLFALGLTLVLASVARSINLRSALALEVASLVVLVGDMTVGNLLGLYWKLPWYDKVLHLGGSILVGWIGFLAICKRLHPWLAGVAILLVTLGVGALWEIAEYGVDRMLGRSTQSSPGMSPLDDTMFDLIVGGIGGIVAAVSGPIYLRSAQP